jgi:hypothetical protein
MASSFPPASNKLEQRAGVQALETTIVIDPQGQIAYRSDGALPAHLAQIVRDLA